MWMQRIYPVCGKCGFTQFGDIYGRYWLDSIKCWINRPRLASKKLTPVKICRMHRFKSVGLQLSKGVYISLR